MTSLSTTESNSAKRKWWQVHKRTLLIVFCFVMVPWVLITVPGEASIASGTMGIGITHSKYGWPFVHLDGTSVNRSGYWVDKKFILGKEPGFNVEAFTKKQHDDFVELNEKELSRLRFDSRLRPADYYDHIGSYGYWSHARNWPSWSASRKYTFRPLGLVCNLLVLSAMCLIIAVPIERKFRKPGKLLNFSLLSFVVGFLLLSVVTAYCVQSYYDRVRELATISKLESMSATDKIYSYDVEQTARFPKLISQLLDHGQFPFDGHRWFGKLDSGKIDLDLDHVEPESLDEIISVTQEGPFSLGIEAYYYNPQLEESISRLDSAVVVERLTLDYEIYDWVESVNGVIDEEKPWSKQVELAGIEIQMAAEFKHLKDLSLSLDSEGLDQRDQLRPFCGLPSLESISISNLTKVGAEYLLETKDQWPVDAEFDFDFVEGVSDELREQLDRAFPNKSISNPGLISVIPVVG